MIVSMSVVQNSLILSFLTRPVFIWRARNIFISSNVSSFYDHSLERSGNSDVTSSLLSMYRLVWSTQSWIISLGKKNLKNFLDLLKGQSFISASPVNGSISGGFEEHNQTNPHLIFFNNFVVRGLNGIFSPDHLTIISKNLF